MSSPHNKPLINALRLVMGAILLFTLYGGLFGDRPYTSTVSSWGDVWQGLFMTNLLAWALLEVSNFYIKKTRVGHLPGIFWGLLAGISGLDFGADFFRLFEITDFDKIAHFTTGVLGGLIFLALIKRVARAYEYKLHRGWIYLLMFMTVNFLATIYEFVELVGDRYFGSLNITGRFDTTGDLLFDNLGVLLVLTVDLIIAKIGRRTRKPQH